MGIFKVSIAFATGNFSVISGSFWTLPDFFFVSKMSKSSEDSTKERAVLLSHKEDFVPALHPPPLQCSMHC